MISNFKKNYLTFRKEDTEEQPKLLDPDHPLLDKFQRALKEHLQKQIEILNSEIFEYVSHIIF